MYSTLHTLNNDSEHGNAATELNSTEELKLFEEFYSRSFCLSTKNYSVLICQAMSIEVPVYIHTYSNNNLRNNLIIFWPILVELSIFHNLLNLSHQIDPLRITINSSHLPQRVAQNSSR